MAARHDRMRGASGNAFDRQVERLDQNALSMMQRRYWEAKQIFLKNVKRKEDECVVSSDADLDAKLELFRSIEDTCSHLLWALERYQDRIWVMAHEESSIGRFLRDGARVDTTRAGVMMSATGRTMGTLGQLRLRLRSPLVKLYQDIETFQYRAVTDTYETISKTEKCRNNYRAALLWMKDASQNLNPDSYKQLEKYRKVQSHVRRSKIKFEKLKLDTHQKIDMLSASRVNLLSNSLTVYQMGLQDFFHKAGQILTSVSELFVGFQYFESNILRDVKDGKRQTIEESVKKGIESKLALIFCEDEKKGSKESSAKVEKASADLVPDSRPVAESATNALLDLSPTQPQDSTSDACASSVVSQSAQDFLTDFDSSEKEMLNELFAICQSAPPDSINKTVESPASHGHHLPSQLVQQFPGLAIGDQRQQESGIGAKVSAAQKQVLRPEDKWLNLFSELDPLSNPDAVGKSAEDDRNC